MTAGRLGARLWWGFVPLVILLWGSGALLSTSLPGLPATPLATLAFLPGVAFARDVTLAVTIGGLLTLLMCDATRVRRWTLAWGVATLGLVALGAAALRADLAASDLASAQGDVDLTRLVLDTYAGRAIIVEAACLVVALLLVAVSDRRALRWAALLLALAGAAAPAFSGHAGLAGEHAAAGVSVALHVVAVCLWVGGLAVVSGLMLVEPDRAPVLLPRFSLLALGCVIVVAESGLLTASLNAGTLADLLGSTYGSIVVAKGVLLGWLIRLGWLQRRRAVDLLTGPSSASVPATVARLAGLEFLVMGTALAASVVLTRIGPAPVPSAGFAPLTLVALGLGAPMVVLLAWPRGWRVTDALPEVAIVALLVVLVEVGGVGLLRELLGGVGLLIELAILVLVGWMAVSSLRLATARVAMWLGIIGLPIAMAAVVLLGDGVSVQMTIVATVLGEALLLMWRRRQDAPSQPDAVAAEAMAG